MDTSPHQRLARVRAAMQRAGVDALIVRGTDRYLNEYVPATESTRVWLTGFAGSTGDALVGLAGAWLFVDGRYHVQADREVDLGLWTVVKNPLGVSNDAACATRLRELASERAARVRVGYEPSRYSLTGFDALTSALAGADVEIVPLDPSPVEDVRGTVQPSSGAVRTVDEGAAGRTVAAKLVAVADWLRTQQADGLLVQKLDEVAWLTNLRGDELPYQATFRSEALVAGDTVWLNVHTATVPDAVRAARPGVRFVTAEGFRRALSTLGDGSARPRIAVDPASVTVALRDLAAATPAEIVRAASPIVALKARKTPEELAAMRSAFARADRVVAESQQWLTDAVARGHAVTEVDFAREVERRFRASGAVGLSFRVISAFGTNGAVVHHPPSAETVIREGELMLLDTGCYYEEGYATDLTRTFFVGGVGVQPTDAQRRLYTLTLKSAIAGMSARVPANAVGAQLDGITRAPLWAAGMDYGHGTGHGVGINVHEAPPRIANTSVTPIEVGHVFSIEPGIYLEGVGGVRIENLCTVVPDPAFPGFLRVEPLTFAPLDLRLVDDAMLTPGERDFVGWYAARAG